MVPPRNNEPSHVVATSGIPVGRSQAGSVPRPVAGAAVLQMPQPVLPRSITQRLRPVPALAPPNDQPKKTPISEITLALKDVLPQVPKDLLMPNAMVDPERTLSFSMSELSAEMARGRPSVSLSSVAHQCPDLFNQQAQLRGHEMIRLPLQKLLEQIGALKRPTVRLDQRTPSPLCVPVVRESPPLASWINTAVTQSTVQTEDSHRDDESITAEIVQIVPTVEQPEVNVSPPILEEYSMPAKFEEESSTQPILLEQVSGTEFESFQVATTERVEVEPEVEVELPQDAPCDLKEEIVVLDLLPAPSFAVGNEGTEEVARSLTPDFVAPKPGDSAVSDFAAFRAPLLPKFPIRPPLKLSNPKAFQDSGKGASLRPQLPISPMLRAGTRTIRKDWCKGDIHPPRLFGANPLDRYFSAKAAPCVNWNAAGALLSLSGEVTPARLAKAIVSIPQVFACLLVAPPLLAVEGTWPSSMGVDNSLAFARRLSGVLKGSRNGRISHRVISTDRGEILGVGIEDVLVCVAVEPGGVTAANREKLSVITKAIAHARFAAQHQAKS